MRFHLILSNPPYVAAGDPALAHLRAEPDVALTPGPTGLEAFAAIAAGAAAHLHAGGWLLLEHGAGQAAPVAELLRRRGFLQISTHPDHSGRDRVTLATTPPSSEERS
jgi:release factor glutamine methyltransferase